LFLFYNYLVTLYGSGIARILFWPKQNGRERRRRQSPRNLGACGAS